MQNPASLVPLKNISLLWTESSAQSALNRPLSTWSEAEDAIHTTAALACDPANMTDERQREFLAENERLCPGGAAWAARILDGYDLGGAP
jgi:hypothetical protein